MSLLPVEDALSRILSGVAPLPAETVELHNAHGRTLSEGVEARITQPPFDASAMDGYAVRAEDIETTPVTLQVIGEAPAGSAFEGTVGAGQAVRIFTGGPVPGGADAIVIQENTETEGNTVTILKPGGTGQFVRPRGLDFKEGERLLSAGTVLGSREIALAAAMNHPALAVRREPAVAILPSGDELIEPGGTPRPDQIISSNNYGIAAFVKRFGGKPMDLGVAADRSEAIESALKLASGADILVTIGGASVGKHDLMQDALTSAGMELDFWKIAMRPGKPLIFGRLGETRVLGLPGNPVSAFVCAAIFLRPLLAAMLGRETDNQPVYATLGEDVGQNDERQDYLRARLTRASDGSSIATPFSRQDSSMLRTLAQSDCMIIRPPHDEPRRKGETVEILVCDF